MGLDGFAAVCTGAVPTKKGMPLAATAGELTAVAFLYTCIPRLGICQRLPFRPVPGLILELVFELLVVCIVPCPRLHNPEPCRGKGLTGDEQSFY